MDISKNNSFLTEEAIDLLLAPRKERRYQHVKCVSPLRFCPHLSWKLKRCKSTAPIFELFC